MLPPARPSPDGVTRSTRRRAVRPDKQPAFRLVILPDRVHARKTEIDHAVRHIRQGGFGRWT
jgi:hypothetical protein